jgi:hypothetical protein
MISGIGINLVCVISVTVVMYLHLLWFLRFCMTYLCYCW